VKRLKLVEYKLFDKVRIYSVLFDDKDQNETDAFISRFDSDKTYKEDFDTIIYWISRIGEYGALERYFRNEWKAKAIPITSSKLRLYCVRLSNNILILRNGGVKTSKKVQDSPDCYPHFEAMNAFKKNLDNRVKNSKVFINDNKLEGQLDFLI